MKSLKTLLAVVALSFGASALVVHAEADAPKKDKPAAGAKEEKPKAPSVFGEITKIDGSTLTLSTKGKPAKEGEKAVAVEKTVILADTVEVKIDGEKKTVGDLKVGERARIVLDGPDGKGIKVEVKTNAGKKKDAPAATK